MKSLGSRKHHSAKSKPIKFTSPQDIQLIGELERVCNINPSRKLGSLNCKAGCLFFDSKGSWQYKHLCLQLALLSVA